MLHLTDITGKPLGFRESARSQDRSPIRLEKPPATVSYISSGPTTAPAPAVTRVRRRNRMITSCLECRRRKLKCDKSHPCTNCLKNSRDCLFLAPALDSVAQMKLTEIKDKMGSLERVLEQDVAKKGSRPGLFRHSQAVDVGEVDFASELEDEGYLEETPLALTDNAYDDDADDDLSDLGFAMGKMRLTERVGGYFRPKMAEEVGSRTHLFMV